MTSSSSDLLDIIVGEFTLLGGRRQSDMAHLAVLKPPRRAHADRHSETLFVFLDLGGGGAGGLARAMVEHFTRTYWRCSGTVTSALRQAINAANAHMMDENRLLAINQRRRGGLVCAVLRNDNVYLAQAGPAQALLAQGERAIQIPAVPREDVPLGVSSGLDIRFFHHYLNAGDRLLLTGESWSATLSEDALANTLSLAGAEEIILELERWAGGDTVSALVIEFALPGVPSATSAELPAREEEGAWDAGAVPPAPHGREALSPGTQRRWRLSNPLAGLSPGAERVDQVRRGLRRAGLALSDGARTLLIRVLPGSDPTLPRRRRRTRSSTVENVPVMAAIAVAIPLLVVFVVVTFYLQRSAVSRREALINEARAAIQAARQAGDPLSPAAGSAGEEAHARWDAALYAAQEALRVAPQNAQLIAMRDEARATLDALDGIVRPDLTLLRDYGAGQGRCLAATRMQVYVLDADQVTQPILDQARQGTADDQLALVAYRGQSVGEAQIGELRDIVWLEAGGTWVSDALLILTADNRLLQHSLSWGLSWVPLDTGLAHVNAHVLRPFDGKLYILDPEQSQVWRFPLGSDGFGPPDGYFPAAAPDLSNAIDMTIDGAVYILLADGRIYKFFGGEAQPYQPTGLPQPLVRPVALVSEGDAVSGALYLADAGAQSIVALDKSGQFIHQIKAAGDAWAGLEALTIQESSRTLYVLAGGRLYALDLPLLPEPAQTAE